MSSAIFTAILILGSVQTPMLNLESCTTSLSAQPSTVPRNAQCLDVLTGKTVFKYKQVALTNPAAPYVPAPVLPPAEYHGPAPHPCSNYDEWKRLTELGKSVEHMQCPSGSSKAGAVAVVPTPAAPATGYLREDNQPDNQRWM